MSLKQLVAGAIVAGLALQGCGKTYCETVFDAEAYVHEAFWPCAEYEDDYDRGWYPEQFICDGVAIAFGEACRAAKLAEADCLLLVPACQKGQEDEFEAKKQACRDLSASCNENEDDD